MASSSSSSSSNVGAPIGYRIGSAHAPPPSSSSSSSSSAPPSCLLLNGIVSSRPNFIVAHSNQRNNLQLVGLIKNIKVGYATDDTLLGDFVLTSTCILYLTSRYHIQKPDYIRGRIERIGDKYKTKVVLVHVDNDCDPYFLESLNILCSNNNFSLVLAWSFAECARYIESLAYYEGKPSTSIQEKQETEFLPRLQKCLLNVRSVQKPDVQTLLDNFGSFKQICTASEQQLLLCPGFGEKKAKRLHQIMNFPLNSSSSVAASSSSSSSSLSSKKAKTKSVDNEVDTTISGV